MIQCACAWFSAHTVRKEKFICVSTCKRHTNLSIHQLDDVLLAPEPLQQRDLIHKPLAGLRVLALQLDALQGKDLAVGGHHLCQRNNGGRGFALFGLILGGVAITCTSVMVSDKASHLLKADLMCQPDANSGRDWRGVCM